MSVKVVVKPGGLVLLAAICVAGIAVPRFLSSSKPDAASAPATPTVTVAPEAPTAPHVVFEDALGPGWQNQSWAKSTRLDYTTIAHGKAAVLYKSDAPFEGLKFASNDFDTSPYDRIALQMHGGAGGGQRLRASGEVVNGTGKADGKKGIFLAPLPAGKWQTVVIPLKMLGLDHQKGGIGFFMMDNENKVQEIVVDDIRFLKPDETVEGTPLKLAPAQLTKTAEGKLYFVVDDKPEPLVKP